MTRTQKHSDLIPPDERQAFDIWFGRTIRSLYEPVIHEPLPEDIVRALPTSKPER